MPYSVFRVPSATDCALVQCVVLLLHIVVSSMVGSCAESALLYVTAHFCKVSILVAVKALCNLAFPDIWLAVV